MTEQNIRECTVEISHSNISNKSKKMIIDMLLESLPEDKKINAKNVLDSDTDMSGASASNNMKIAYEEIQKFKDKNKKVKKIGKFMGAVFLVSAVIFAIIAICKRQVIFHRFWQLCFHNYRHFIFHSSFLPTDSTGGLFISLMVILRLSLKMISCFQVDSFFLSSGFGHTDMTTYPGWQLQVLYHPETQPIPQIPCLW